MDDSDNSRESVSVHLMLMMMTIIQHWFIKRQRQRRQRFLEKKVHTQAYQPPIPYNRLSQFTLSCWNG